MTLTAIPPTSAVRVPAATQSPDAQAAHKVREAARQFEAILVRQMLKASGVGGKDKESPYAGMIVDAVADGVTAGKGLGLAQKIADALARGTHGSHRR